MPLETIASISLDTPNEETAEKTLKGTPMGTLPEPVAGNVQSTVSAVDHLKPGHEPKEEDSVASEMVDRAFTVSEVLDQTPAMDEKELPLYDEDEEMVIGKTMRTMTSLNFEQCENS